MTKILVIDDEPSIINPVTADLKPEGSEVYTASEGKAGLKAVRTFKPDLIVLDLMLPGMDAIELLSRLRRESDIYVIMLTARTDEVDKIVGLSVGADDDVTKPFSPREFVARVKAALKRIKSETGSSSERSVLSPEQLLEKVRGTEYFGELRVVDVHLGHVRQKLGNESLITTVRGAG
ncbi:MAG: response regulator transcription factor [Anaerolineales bacterium]